MIRFDAQRGFTNRQGASSYAHLQRLITPHLRPGSTIVDIGCGTGEFFAALPALAGHRIGIDPDHAAIAEVQRRHRQAASVSHAEWRVGTFADTGLPTASVDLVCSHSALMLAPNLPAARDEMARILRPGGVVAAVLPLFAMSEYDAEYGYYMGTMAYIARVTRAHNYQLPHGVQNDYCGSSQKLRPFFSPATGFSHFTAQEFTIDFSGTPAEIIEVIAQMYTFAALPSPAQSLAFESARTYLTTHMNPDGTVPFRRPFWSFIARRVPVAGVITPEYNDTDSDVALTV